MSPLLNIAFDKLMCNENNVCLNPDEFEIVEVYRFEGDSNPSDEDVVYAIASKDGNSKGVVTSAFGMYADNACAEMIKKLSIKTKQHPLQLLQFLLLTSDVRQYCPLQKVLSLKYVATNQQR